MGGWVIHQSRETHISLNSKRHAKARKAALWETLSECGAGVGSGPGCLTLAQGPRKGTAGPGCPDGALLLAISYQHPLRGKEQDVTLYRKCF